MKKIVRVVFGICILMMFFSCEGRIDDVTNFTKCIPAGYIGRVLTPTGWGDKIIESGQVDLGRVGINGGGNVLVLLEATSIATKEQFLPADSSDKSTVDHRVMTAKKIPLELDCYVRLALPDDKEVRNSVFALVTPTGTNDPRIQKISLEVVYTQFARMDIRGKIREIISKYDDDGAVLKDLEGINRKFCEAGISIFKANGVPLKLQNCQISNMKVDDIIWQAETKNMAATAEAARIRTIGEAMRDNPGYAEYIKWQVIEKSGIKDLTVIDNGMHSPIAISPGMK